MLITVTCSQGFHRRRGVQGQRAHHLQRHHDQRRPQHGLHHRLHQRHVGDVVDHDAGVNDVVTKMWFLGCVNAVGKVGQKW